MFDFSEDMDWIITARFGPGKLPLFTIEYTIIESNPLISFIAMKHESFFRLSYVQD